MIDSDHPQPDESLAIRAIIGFIPLFLLIICLVGMIIVLDCNTLYKICAISGLNSDLVASWEEDFTLSVTGENAHQILAVRAGKSGEILNAAVWGGIGGLAGVSVVMLPLLIGKGLLDNQKRRRERE